MATDRIRRDEIEDSFRPLLPLLQSVIASARKATDVEVIAKGLPAVTRVAHRRRLSGASRWMCVADGLVAGEWPAGYGVESSDADHNQGRYAFRFPLGIFTVKREPHAEEEEGQYLQQRLEGMHDETIDSSAHPRDLKVYVSVPPTGHTKVIVTHKDLEQPLEILLADLAPPAVVPERHPASKGPTRRRARSSRKTKVSLPQEGGSGAPS